MFEGRVETWPNPKTSVMATAGFPSPQLVGDGAQSSQYRRERFPAAQLSAGGEPKFTHYANAFAATR